MEFLEFTFQDLRHWCGVAALIVLVLHGLAAILRELRSK